MGELKLSHEWGLGSREHGGWEGWESAFGPILKHPQKRFRATTAAILKLSNGHLPKTEKGRYKIRKGHFKRNENLDNEKKP